MALGILLKVWLLKPPQWLKIFIFCVSQTAWNSPLNKNLKYVIAQDWNTKDLRLSKFSFLDTTYNLQKFHVRQQILLFNFTENGRKSVFIFCTKICYWNYKLENLSQIFVVFISFVLWVYEFSFTKSYNRTKLLIHAICESWAS